MTRASGALRWGLAAVWATVLAALLVAAVGWLRPQWLGRLANAAAPARPLSVAEWLAGHSADWRVARQQENPAVLVIEFPSLAAQGAAMNRIAALLEKADAPRDRVLGDAELAAVIARSGDSPQTFYQGHDYDGAGLARFYGQVRRQGLALNAQEERVRRLLLQTGLLQETPDGGLRQQGAQALITFTATQADDPATPADETVDDRRRESVLRHESSHGRYYTRAVYREHCRRFWHEILSDAQREGMRRFLAGLGYDSRDEELILNEAQAFMMNTPDSRAFSAADGALSDTDLAELRTRFWRTLPADATSGP